MGLDVPELDDKDYEQLLESATQLIPAYSEQWTDHNPQDPGITVLETLAWLTETYIYQVDTVTDAHREKYLALLGERPRPPQVASTKLDVETPDGGAGDRIPEGERLEVVEGSGDPEPFETTAPVVLTEATVGAVVTDAGGGSTDNTDANRIDGMSYRPFGGDPDPGEAVYVGFDGDPFEAADELSLTVDFHDEDLPDTGTHGEEESYLDPSVELAWEYCTDDENWRHDGAWNSLSVAYDGTDALYGGGRITFDRPGDWAPDEWATGERGVFGRDDLVWIRCRVVRGGYEIPPEVNALAVNVVPVAHRGTVKDERLERDPPDDPAAGLGGQVYRFDHSPVLEATIRVDGDRWTRVEDFDASDPTDRHYVLDPTAGVVRFGDGKHGAVPGPDADVTAERYVFGGGEAGNATGSATWRFTAADRTVGGVPLAELSVSARRSASGGQDAESIDAAVRRVRRDLKRSYRGVTHDDLTEIATNTPGLRFGRATVHWGTATGAPATDHDSPQESRVVVVPYAPPDAGVPVPSEGFLDAVTRHLDRHRLLSDRVQVVGPTYVGLDVEVAVVTDGSLSRSRMESELAASVESYVDPLRGYDGDGWPFGRTLYVADLAEVVADESWVESVRDVSLHVGEEGRVDGEGNAAIGQASLFAIDGVSVSAERRGDRDRPSATGRGPTPGRDRGSDETAGGPDRTPGGGER